MPEMIQENAELLRRLGFLPDAILLNYTEEKAARGSGG
jgi:hypothetical protein